jgi:hypothetical protein
VIVEAYDEDEEEYHREIVEQNTELAERITQLEAVKPKVTRQIVQQPFLSDAKRAQLEELKQ